jgi:hypothetical protein
LKENLTILFNVEEIIFHIEAGDEEKETSINASPKSTTLYQEIQKNPEGEEGELAQAEENTVFSFPTRSLESDTSKKHQTQHRNKSCSTFAS